MKTVIALAFAATITTFNTVRPEDQSTSEDAMETAPTIASLSEGNDLFSLIDLGDVDIDDLLSMDPNADCDKSCALANQPLCGCDGITYESKCKFSVAQCEAIKKNRSCCILSTGVGARTTAETVAAVRINCYNDTVCSTEYKPICGTNNVTYENECEFEAAQCNVTEYGELLYMQNDGECFLSGSSSSTKDSAAGSGTNTGE
ncbi:hypothetical protein F444_13083 [Phytophthora nicotianae P1976]|uniref:Kazal-like domain-containing protein n=1 Tax=Phytophthora nicotianae P1976 TaxID=1317066 RepID=A0A080ZUV5_PHYNI|nr:hypothetical protein F444_13083 [Phytophthora nicotianae P1976]